MNPQAEPFTTEFSQRGLVLHQLLYNTNSCQVYRVFDQKLQLPAVIKLELHPTSTPSFSQREVDNLWRCRHPNIVQLYDCFWFYLSDTLWVSAIEVELMAKDLGKEIADRAKNAYPWNEHELMEFLTTVVRALSFAQGLKIAHRDIKPQNIFLKQGMYKLGDFGSSKFIEVLAGPLSLLGTPLYLSPILRESLFQRRSGVVHNPYKSDVFSLGLTILHMATLSPLMKITGIEIAISEVVDTLSYSENVKNYLRWMLAMDEKNRPDFVEMQKALEPITSPLTPESPAKEGELTTPTVLDIDKTVLESSQHTTKNPESELREIDLRCIHLQSDPSLPNLLLCCKHAICQTCTKMQFFAFGIRVECVVCKQAQEFVFSAPSTCIRCTKTQSSLIEISAKSVRGRFCLKCVKEMLKHEDLVKGDVFNALVSTQAN